MFDLSLFQKMLNHKFKTLLWTYGVSGLIALLLWGFSSPMDRGIRATGETQGELFLLAVSFLIGLVVYCFIQAYQDYYDHFPMAIFAGKTRRQFLLQMILTSLIVTTIGFGVIVFIGVLQVALLDPGWFQILGNRLPENVKGWQMAYYGILFIFSMLLFTVFLASLNYRFGARIWIVYAAFILVGNLLKFNPAVNQLFRFLDLSSLNQWNEIAHGNVLLRTLLEWIKPIGMVLISSFITLRLEPISKQKLS